MTPIGVYATAPPSTTTTSAATLPFGEYLFRRLQQVHKVKSIFGVPGDFNLGLLEHLYKTDLEWIGGCNELNSGYSADGYSRYTGSLGVVITTYGVGELSCTNAIAGAFAEHVKVLHIVGMPRRSCLFDAQQKKKHLHHLVNDIDPLADSDRFVYTRMVEKICCASEIVTEPTNAASQVDSVIKEMFKTSRPGVIFLPLDMSEELVDASGLALDPASEFHKVQDNETVFTQKLADMILDRIYKSSNPAILADVLVGRYHQGVELLRELVNVTNIHSYTTFMGKSILDEYHPSFVGDYIGLESNKGVKENLEDSDCVLFFGPYKNEINTGHYSFDLQEGQLILLHPEYIKIGSELFRGINFVNVLSAMLVSLDVKKVPLPRPVLCEVSPRYPHIPSGAAISQSVLLKKFESFLEEGDVVVCETGSFMFGIPDFRFKSHVSYIAQGFYLSIGMALPCSVGVGIAMRDEGSTRRLILVEGDGSAQMTIQEISSFPHYGLTPIIFLLNNSGYTVERIILGEHRSYNDIKPWNWKHIFDLFEFGKQKHCLTETVNNEKELELALQSVNEKRDKLQFFEVILDKLDCPWRFFHMNNYRLFPLDSKSS
jgi:phenylpyruvate decarboxylase